MRKEIKQILEEAEKQDLNWNDIFKVTDVVVQNILDTAIPFYTPFGSFYVLQLPKKFNACMYLLYDEKDFYWMIESLKLDKKDQPIPIPNKKMIKILCWLVKYNCLTLRGVDPFEEFAPAPKPPKVFAILEPPGGWGEVYKELIDDSFYADDDVADLETFIKESKNDD